MPTIVPLTAEYVWLRWLAEQTGSRDWQPEPVPTLVVAPHPDDETLGAGGLIARLRAGGVPVMVAALTDGEGAYADTPGEQQGAVRVAEQDAALRCLGVEPGSVRRFGLPDRYLTAHMDQLAGGLRAMVVPGMHLVAPWPHDFHPDHEAAGLAAQSVARELDLRLTFYLFWTWHRGEPATLQDAPLLRLTLSADEQARKERAISAFASQLEHADGQPILSDELLRPARRGFEVYIAS